MTGLASGLLAAGFAVFVIAGLATPPRLYQEPSPDARLRIIDRGRTRFLVAQALWAAWLGIPAIGFVLLATELHPPVGWLPPIAAIVAIAGALGAAAYVVLQTMDPRRYWLDGAGTWVSTLSAWILILAAALFGLSMIQLEAWATAGIVLLVFAGLGALVALRVPASAFYIGVGFCLSALAPAVVLWQMLAT